MVLHKSAQGPGTTGGAQWEPSVSRPLSQKVFQFYLSKNSIILTPPLLFLITLVTFMLFPVCVWERLQVFT